MCWKEPKTTLCAGQLPFPPSLERQLGGRWQGTDAQLTCSLPVLQSHWPLLFCVQNSLLAQKGPTQTPQQWLSYSRAPPRINSLARANTPLQEVADLPPSSIPRELTVSLNSLCPCLFYFLGRGDTFKNPDPGSAILCRFAQK